jgi:hypothetical protein
VSTLSDGGTAEPSATGAASRRSARRGRRRRVRCVATLVLGSFVFGACTDGADEHTTAWCSVYADVAELMTSAGPEAETFTDPSPEEAAELQRLASRFNDLGYPEELAGVEATIAEGPGPDGTPQRARYDEAVADLETFVVDECGLSPETVDVLTG